jgi:hypothetical protein
MNIHGGCPLPADIRFYTGRNNRFTLAIGVIIRFVERTGFPESSWADLSVRIV